MVFGKKTDVVRCGIVGDLDVGSTYGVGGGADSGFVEVVER